MNNGTLKCVQPLEDDKLMHRHKLVIQQRPPRSVHFDAPQPLVSGEEEEHGANDVVLEKYWEKKKKKKKHVRQPSTRALRVGKKESVGCACCYVLCVWEGLAATLLATRLVVRPVYVSVSNHLPLRDRLPHGVGTLLDAQQRQHAASFCRYQADGAAAFACRVTRVCVADVVAARAAAAADAAGPAHGHGDSGETDISSSPRSPDNTRLQFIFMLCAAALGAYYTFVVRVGSGPRIERPTTSKVPPPLPSPLSVVSLSHGSDSTAVADRRADGERPVLEAVAVRSNKPRHNVVRTSKRASATFLHLLHCFSSDARSFLSNAKLAAKVAAGQLAASYFTFSAGPSAVFPFVSYPAWNVLAWSMNATANVRAMAWLPLVLSSQVDAFWAFANATVGVQWANATAAMLGYGTKAGFEAGVALVRAAVAAGPYGLPSAVRVPINASDPLHFIVLQEGLLAGNERAILYDALSEPIHAAAAMEAYTSQNASISDFLVLAQARRAVEDEAFVKRLRFVLVFSNVSLQDVATGTNRFASVVYTPVFQGASVVGLSNSYWMWDTVVESALPTFFTGIVVVVTSTSTGKSITMVGGPNGFSSFEGDASGSKSVVPSSAVRFVSSASVGNTSFAIVVYPTTALLASYETDDPRNHAIEARCVPRQSVTHNFPSPVLHG